MAFGLCVKALRTGRETAWKSLCAFKVREKPWSYRECVWGTEHDIVTEHSLCTSVVTVSSRAHYFRVL